MAMSRVKSTGLCVKLRTFCAHYSWNIGFYVEVFAWNDLAIIWKNYDF
jgi:hypothetical protein